MNEIPLIDPEVARVRLLLAEFRLCAVMHAEAGKTTHGAALKWWNAACASTWHLAALAVQQALKPTFVGAPPARFAQHIENALKMAEQAAADALNGGREAAGDGDE